MGGWGGSAEWGSGIQRTGQRELEALILAAKSKVATPCLSGFLSNPRVRPLVRTLAEAIPTFCWVHNIVFQLILKIIRSCNFTIITTHQASVGLER